MLRSLVQPLHRALSVPLINFAKPKICREQPSRRPKDELRRHDRKGTDRCEKRFKRRDSLNRRKWKSRHATLKDTLTVVDGESASGGLAAARWIYSKRN
jgi:hypothetical protein